MKGKEINAILKERKGLAKEVTVCLLPFSGSFGGGQQCTAHPIPSLAGMKLFRAGSHSLGSSSAHPCIREGDAIENKSPL